MPLSFYLSGLKIFFNSLSLPVPLSVIMSVFSSFFFSLFLCLCHHTWVYFLSLVSCAFVIILGFVFSLSLHVPLFVVIPDSFSVSLSLFICLCHHTCFLLLLFSFFYLCLSVPSLVVWQRDCTPVCATRLALP